MSNGDTRLEHKECAACGHVGGRAHPCPFLPHEKLMEIYMAPTL